MKVEIQSPNGLALNNTSSYHYILFCFPAFHHGQVAVWSDGIFQAASPPALEEPHLPPEKQGAHIFVSQKKSRVVC